MHLVLVTYFSFVLIFIPLPLSRLAAIYRDTYQHKFL